MSNWIRAKPGLNSGGFEKEPFLDFHPGAFTPGVYDKTSMSLKVNIHCLKIRKDYTLLTGLKVIDCTMQKPDLLTYVYVCAFICILYMCRCVHIYTHIYTCRYR